MTAPIRITCKKIDEIPDAENLSLLADKDHHVVLQFPIKTVVIDKTALVQDFSNKLPEYSVFDSGGNSENECITIKAVIKRGNILEHEKMIKTAIEEYIRTCVFLRNKYIETVSKRPKPIFFTKVLRTLSLNHVNKKTIEGDWEFYEHGLEVCFTNIVTRQIVEVPLRQITLENIDPYFLGKFIKTTPELSTVASLINDTFHDSARILDMIRKRKK